MGLFYYKSYRIYEKLHGIQETFINKNLIAPVVITSQENEPDDLLIVRDSIIDSKVTNSLAESNMVRDHLTNNHQKPNENLLIEEYKEPSQSSAQKQKENYKTLK